MAQNRWLKCPQSHAWNDQANAQHLLAQMENRMHQLDGNDKSCRIWLALNVQHTAAAGDWVERPDTWL